MNTKNIAWLAGLLEGEGCFDIKRGKDIKYPTPRITIEMTDKDTIIKASFLLGSGRIFYKNRKFCKPTYAAHITGNRAVQWMMTLYSIMSIRRKIKIKELINIWKQTNYPRAFVNGGYQ